MIQVLDLRCQNQERPQGHGQHGHRTWDRDPGHMGQGPGFRDPDPGDIPGNQIRNLDAVEDDFLQGMCAHMWKHDDNMFLPSWNCGTRPPKGFGKSGEKEKRRDKRSQGTQAGLTPSLLRHTWGPLKKSGALRPWNGPSLTPQQGPVGWARAVTRVSGLHSLTKNTAKWRERESHACIPVIVQHSLYARHCTWCWKTVSI